MSTFDFLIDFGNNNIYCVFKNRYQCTLFGYIVGSNDVEVSDGHFT